METADPFDPQAGTHNDPEMVHLSIHRAIVDFSLVLLAIALAKIVVYVWLNVGYSRVKKDRHGNSVARKITSINVTCFRCYQRTSDGMQMRYLAEKLRITLHWEMHGLPRKMAIEQRIGGCLNEIGSFDVKHSPPQTRLRRIQSKSDTSGSTYVGESGS